MHADLTSLTWLGLTFAVAVALAVVLVRLKLPVVVGYLGAGLLLGPAGLGLVERGHAVDLLAEIGVTLLLFTIGLEFSLGELKRSWRAVVLAGGAQVLLTTAAVAGVAVALGRTPAQGVAWGFLIALSSTAVILRLLDIRGESKAAHGRLVIGVLIFQDLCIVPMMLLLPVLGGTSSGAGAIALVLTKAVGVVVFTVLAGRVVVPQLMRAAAKTRDREVFLLAVLAVASLVAFATMSVGLSPALGAFLAGMVLADTHYSHQALADVLPLRTVMMCVFFVSVGMLVDPEIIRSHPVAIGGLVAAVLVGKGALFFLVGLGLRFPVPVAALAGAALAQVGEFSLVLAAEAEHVGLLSEEERGIFLSAAVATIAIAPVVVMLSPRWVAGSRLLAPLQRRLDRRHAQAGETEPVQTKGHVIVAGTGIGGRLVLAALEQAGTPAVVLDLNAESVIAQRAAGREAVYGDVTNAEVLRHAGIADAAALVLVVSDHAAAHRAVEVARELRPDLHIVLRTRYASDEAAERGPHTDVVSEEFAGALGVCRHLLDHLGTADVEAILRPLDAAHGDWPEEDLA